MSLRKNRFPSTASMLLVFLALAALILAWQSALLGTPTAEAALFLGIFLAPITFLAGACRGALRNHKGFQDDVLREGMWVLGTVTAYLFLLYVHSVGLQSCSASIGIWPFLILIGPQLFLNLVTGVWIGRLLGNVKLAVIASSVLWLAYMGLQTALWWINPSMRFFEPYWLMIVGDLLQGQSLDPAIIAYRIGNLLLGIALLVLGMTWKRHANQFWAVFILLFAAFTLQWKSSAMIAPALSEREQAYPDLVTRGPLALHTNLEDLGEDRAEAILQEATLWLSRLKERTGIETHQTIHIWLYKNQESLAHYMGAKNVHFTLPSHREIHVTNTEIPHPTLGHELAHVVLGQVSETLWGTPGILGLIPNWGLSEGLATYLTPELNIHEDLTTQEQAFALYRLGLEKHPEDLLTPDLWSFWIQSSSRAYTVSAAMIEAYIDSQCRTSTCRSKVIVRLAKSGDIALSENFLKAYRLKMEQEVLPPDAMPSVAKRYESNSILFADCSVTPKKVTSKTAEQEGDELALRRQFEAASAKYAQIDIQQLPIYEQRQLTLKKAFLKSAPYAVAGLELLCQKPRETLQIGAAYGKLGVSLSPSQESDPAYLYAIYILARTEILAGHFAFGLSKMPSALEGWVGQEAKRVSALARSQIGQAEQAALEFGLLKSQAIRPADRIRFGDMQERANGIAQGQSFLLGVHAKLSDNADLSRFQKES